MVEAMDECLSALTNIVGVQHGDLEALIIQVEKLQQEAQLYRQNASK